MSLIFCRPVSHSFIHSFIHVHLSGFRQFMLWKEAIKRICIPHHRIRPCSLPLRVRSSLLSYSQICNQARLSIFVSRFSISCFISTSSRLAGSVVCRTVASSVLVSLLMLKQNILVWSFFLSFHTVSHMSWNVQSSFVHTRCSVLSCTQNPAPSQLWLREKKDAVKKRLL